MKPTLRMMAVLLLCGSGICAADKPNVVLILTDNQSYYELGCHGHPVLKTPRIDALAAESVDFLNFHAPPYCSPSRGVLMTGRYAMRYGIYTTIQGRSILHRSEVTIADRLKKAGYRTGIFGKWHLGFSYPYMPRHRGFDETFVHGGGGIGQMEDYFGNSHLDATYWRNGVTEPSEGFSTDVLFAEGLKFIETHRDRPFFCFISTPATHKPWQAHPEVLKKLKARGVKGSGRDLALYSMVENIDENVGRVLDKLDALKLAEKTIVIFATDQGMRDRGAPPKADRGDANPPHIQSDERHRVFCMVRYPPLTRPHRSTVLTGMVDMVPTLLDLTGVKKPEGLDGRSLRPLLAGAKRWEDDRELIVQCPRSRTRKKWHNAAVKTQRWRLVDGKNLFDVSGGDPSRDVAGDHPDVVKRLARSYETFWSSLPDDSDSLSRHVLGPNPTRLNGTDWYQGASPWNKNDFRKKSGNGVWAVEVQKPGRYRFELRHYPREAKKPHGAAEATVKVGEVQATAEATDPNHVTVDVALKKGTYDLTATFKSAEGGKSRWGALFVYVSRLGD